MKKTDISKISRSIVLSIIGVLSFILAVFGITYAFFSITVVGNEEASSITINVVDLGTVTFLDGEEIEAYNIKPMLPEEREAKEFTIESAGNEADIDYMIYLTVTQNTFIQVYENEFTYTLSGNSSSGGIVTEDVSQLVPTGGKNLIGEGVLKEGGDKHTYIFTIGLNEVGSNQNSNQNKTFAGKISVETKKYTNERSVWGE